MLQTKHMSIKMLIYKSQNNKLKIAFLKENLLLNLENEYNYINYLKGNIYKGKIKKILHGLNSFLIIYGNLKYGLLPFKEIFDFKLNVFSFSVGFYSIIDDIITLDQNILIQIDKDERMTKISLLTMYLSISGHFLVLIFGDLKINCISKNLISNERINLKKLLFNFNSNELYFINIIIRTSGLNKKFNELKNELNILISQFNLMKNLYEKTELTSLIYENNSLILKILRDYIKYDLKEIIINDILLFNFIIKYLIIINFNYIFKIKLYNKKFDMFSKFNIWNQLEIFFKREIFLLSGGSIVIDQTEALTIFDINSSKFNISKNLEITILQTNLEAIEEISKQVKTRNINGIIIIDLIDVNYLSNFRIIEYTIKYLFSIDKVKIQIGKISEFGLLEILRQSFKLYSIDDEKVFCYSCYGNGKINSIESNAKKILNYLEEESIKNNVNQIHLELPIKTGTYIINIKRKEILKLENLLKIKIILIINKYLTENEYKIYRINFNFLKNNNKPKFHILKNLNKITKHIKFKINIFICLNDCLKCFYNLKIIFKIESIWIFAIK